MTETIADLQTTSEDDDFIESPDFFQPKGFAPDHLPGYYRNDQRTITFTRKDDGNVTFQVEVPLPRKNGTFSKYPYRTWLSTKTYEAANGKGRTSSVAQYLSALGKDPKGLRKSEIVDVVLATASTPVGVEIGWRDKFSERTPDEKLSRKDLKRTKDFRQADGSYQHQVNISDRVWTAEAHVKGFVSLEKVK